MRNLKKILALVLALVMSLSLMATAGAADFKDASSINEKYETAVEVLEGLGVFRGYEDGSFQPTGSITRAETAAIIYRIVTGDVKDEQVGIYADYNLFTDVPATAWYAGYVNYCANAEYIKGVGNGKFDPNAQVTGYAALAMILRAIGYTANGGFTGSDWAVQTARVGEARKITKNILAGTLGQAATRESVAEILFQAIMVNMVGHNVLNSQDGQQGYYELNENLGHKTFGLESIEGVVVANEYANLNGARVLGADKTDLQVAGKDAPTRLAIGTELTDIGESRYAYVTGSKVLAMGDTGKNKVTETGKAVDISSASKFAAVAEMSSNANTEFYTNFDINAAGQNYCEQRLEFSVVFYGEDAEDAFDGYKKIDISKIAAADSEWSVEVNTGSTASPVYTEAELNDGKTDYAPGSTAPAYNYPVRYTKIIWAGKDITSTDLLVLESIFGTADNKNNNVQNSKKITGDVFVGTKSTNNDATDEERDLSNTISYKKFVDEYIISNTAADNWGVTWNGWWTKFVDNNGDGAAEYAFRTNYALEKALYSYTDRDGNTYIEYNDFDDENDAVVYLDGYTPAVGDKVLACYIDGQWLVEPAKSETVTVSSYSWRNDEITTDKDTYGQSGVDNLTDMLQLISTMDDKVEYVVYFDHFGYVRAYELPGSTKYALITEMYYTNGQQGNLVDNWPMTAELTTLEDGETVTKEYNVVGGASTFTAVQPWLRVNNVAATYNYNNWVQPAIAHLGVARTGYAPTKGAADWTGTNSTFWPANQQLVRDIDVNGMDDCEEFNYGKQEYLGLTYRGNEYDWDVDDTASFTNVALVNIDGDDATLAGAATLQLDKNANIQGYATDYVQLSTDDIAAKAVRYPIGGSDAYKTANNNYVNAVHDTQYFIAYNGGVVSFTDYVNFPGLTVDDNQIHAAYAVVRNTNSDLADKPYWVADVIVYEIYDSPESINQTSVSLAFYTRARTSGEVQEIETLNSKFGPEMLLKPESKAWETTKGQWGAEWDGYGFYALFNDAQSGDDANVMTAADIDKITIGKYNKNGIYAGVITREAYIEGAGEYIDVSLGNGKSASIEITDKIYSVTEAKAQSDGWYKYNVADLLRYGTTTANQVRKGDLVIWVGSAKTDGTKSSTSFVVDLGSEIDWSNVTNAYCGADLLADTADFLIDLDKDGKVESFIGATNNSGVYQQIMSEQYESVYGIWDITVKYVDAAGNELVEGVDGVTGLPVLTDPTFVVKSQTTALPLTFTETNYTVSAVSVTSQKNDKDTAVVTLNTAKNVWMLSDVTNDVELTVVVALVPAEPPVDPEMFNVTLTATGVGNVTVTYDDNTVSGTAMDAQIAENTELTLTLANNPSMEYEVKVNNVKINPVSANTYKITVTAATNIVVTGKALVYNVKLTDTTVTKGSVTVMNGATNVTTGLKAAAGLDLPVNTRLTLTLTPALNCEYEVKVNGTKQTLVANACNIDVTKATTIEVIEVDYNMPATDTTTKPGTTIYKLTNDVKLDAKFDVPTTGKTEINLNGHDIDIKLATGNQTGILLANGADLTITGKGTITATTVDAQGKDNGKGNVIVLKGNNNLTVDKDVVIKSSSYTDEDGDGNCYGIVVDPGASNVVIKMNGTLTGACGLTVNGLNKGASVGTIDINGTIDVEDCGLYLAGNAVTNINDKANIIAGHTGIEIRNGRLNMIGGSVAGNVSEPTYFRPTPSGGGSTGFNAGIVASSYGNGAVNVTIYGGVVSGKSQLALQGKATGEISTAMHIEYSRNVITTAPMFGSANEQSTNWIRTADDALNLVILDWVYPAPVPGVGGDEAIDAPEAIEGFEVVNP